MAKLSHRAGVPPEPRHRMFPCFTEAELRAYLSGDLPARAPGRRRRPPAHLRNLPALWDEVRGAYSGGVARPHHLPTRLELTKDGQDSLSENHPDLPDHELNMARGRFAAGQPDD